MSDPEFSNREVDPFTGHDTTGHEWGPIRELNTPFPKIATWAMILTFVYSVITWILLPAWPTGTDYTRGILGLDDHVMADEGFSRIEQARADWVSRLAGTPDFAALADDKVFMADALPAAARLYGDDCAACHGDDAEGGPGFPALTGPFYLWGGSPEALVHTITHGINSDQDDETRFAEMPAFDWLDADERHALTQYVAALPSGEADHDGAAAESFADNCASCHGERGEGFEDEDDKVGAPSLADASVIYGQDVATVGQTLFRGRHGVMPAWGSRLAPEDINLLALYITTLGNRTGAGGGEN